MKTAIPALMLALFLSPAVVAQTSQCSEGADCNKQKARDLLNEGVQAYRANQFDDAIEKFKSASDLDPDLKTARLYLATAHVTLYVPGSPDAANLDHARQAIAAYKVVLSRDPANLPAIDGIGSLLFNMAAGPPLDIDMMKESRFYHQKHIQIRPDDPQPYYWVGLIDWELAYKANVQFRADFNKDRLAGEQLTATASLPDILRVPFAADHGADVDEGIAALNKAIELRPGYDEAMAYLNLLDRQKADMVESPDDRRRLLGEADALIVKILEIKPKNLSQPGQSPVATNRLPPGGIVGVNAPSISPPPPPPPPPPPRVEGPKRVRLAGGVAQAKIIYKVQPEYPESARKEHIQGVVRLHLIVSREGAIMLLDVISGPPLLIQATTEAVRQWRYQPTLLSGEPVEVDTYIDVIFSLGRPSP